MVWFTLPHDFRVQSIVTGFAVAGARETWPHCMHSPKAADDKCWGSARFLLTQSRALAWGWCCPVRVGLPICIKSDLRSHQVDNMNHHIY